MRDGRLVGAFQSRPHPMRTKSDGVAALEWVRRKNDV
jgi:hypothetical protein